MRLLGLDLGTKSLGIALSDSGQIIATGKENFKFAENDFPSAINKILSYMDQYEIETIILGHPIRMNGTKSERTIMAEEFGQKLRSYVNVEVILFDERLSTRIAQQVLISANVSRKKRKLQKDKIAAQIILQNYLDFKSS